MCLNIIQLMFDGRQSLIFLHTQETVTWILQNLNKRLRDWKSELKVEFYISNAKKQVLEAPPSTIFEEQWPGLVHH